ncbi:Rpn family recombination-promoting nuclease/putative transposase [Treponema sp.]|uniref:Rpn family recombination-promoting nuclease/putative transposase n=1 Tax=Treponema sp. TaxID=166 RepID=UPI003EFF4F46
MKEEHGLSPAEKWERATLADNFIFCWVMSSNPDLCREVLELLLGISIERIETPEPERAFKADHWSKGVRFDVYVRDGTGRCFDIEIQTTNRTNLAKRARYYQGLMDVDSLSSGTDYSSLNESYVIFLCMEDAFGAGLPVYEFQQTCRQNPGIKFSDGTHKVFFNASEYDKMPTDSLREFFKFLNGKKADSELAGLLEKKVSLAKANAQWRHTYMTWEMEMKVRSRELAEDMAQDIAQDIAKDMAQGMAKDMAQELAKDMAQGIAKNMAEDMARDMAKEEFGGMLANMLRENVPAGDIARWSGLSLDEVEALRAKYCNS